jgi:hypothetical protein
MFSSVIFTFNTIDVDMFNFEYREKCEENFEENVIHAEKNCSEETVVHAENEML